MSRQRDQITRAVESRDHQVVSLDWEPIYDSGEMCGLAGGWTLIVSPAAPFTPELFGLNMDELLAHVDYSLAPPEPCGCDREHNPLIAATRINDPQKPTHSADCRWHIPYRLRWWPTPTQGGGR